MKDLSNADLLAVLVGSASAKALAAKPLAELFGFSKPRQMQLCEESAAYTVHPALAAAKELFVRCIRERPAAKREFPGAPSIEGVTGSCIQPPGLPGG
jgi:hypothetical protein